MEAGELIDCIQKYFSLESGSNFNQKHDCRKLLELLNYLFPIEVEKTFHFLSESKLTERSIRSHKLERHKNLKNYIFRETNEQKSICSVPISYCNCAEFFKSVSRTNNCFVCKHILSVILIECLDLY